jgi:hypothetical protein
MKIRELKLETINELTFEGDKAFDEWFTRTEGKVFGKNEPVPPRDIWRRAFTVGVQAILQRVDAIKENT